MKKKNKKTGYVFDISDTEGKRLITENSEEFEPLDKRLMPKTKKPKTVKEKVIEESCLKALRKDQIIQELRHLSVKYNPKARKDDLIELLKKTGGV